MCTSPAPSARRWLHFLAHPETDVLYGEAYHTDEQGHVLARYPTEAFAWNRLTDTCFISQPTVFLRRSAVVRVGYLNEGLRYCMDYDLWIRSGDPAASRTSRNTSP